MDYQQRKQMERKRAEDFIASINAMQDPDIMYKVSHPITDLKDMMNQSVARYGADHVAFKQRFVKGEPFREITYGQTLNDMNALGTAMLARGLRDKRVAIIGGQIEGLQGAVFLRKRGREVTVLEPSETFGKGIPPRYLDRLKPWLAKKDVQLLGGVTCDQITDQGVVITTKDNQRKLIEADTVMVLLSQEPDTSLLEALKGSVKEVLCAGSVNGAQVGSLIVNAIEDGRRIGCNL